MRPENGPTSFVETRSDRAFHKCIRRLPCKPLPTDMAIVDIIALAKQVRVSSSRIVVAFAFA